MLIILITISESKDGIHKNLNLLNPRSYKEVINNSIIFDTRSMQQFLGNHQQKR